MERNKVSYIFLYGLSMLAVCLALFTLEGLRASVMCLMALQVVTVAEVIRNQGSLEEE